MTRPFSIQLLILVIASACSTSGIQADDDLAFFEQKIRPVLIEHCYECHSQDSDEASGNLLLDSREGWQQGGDSGELVIVPEQAERSLLVRTIRHLEPGLEMPPDGDKLPDAVIEDFVEWIRRGARDPRVGSPIERKRADKSWWSLQGIEKNLSHDSIDELVATRLKQNGLSMNASADARTLIRRMTYDMHGLPPTLSEVAEFQTAYSVDRGAAIDTLIERLLASPRYGERWGRHWLDVIRFGESIGFERNVIIDDLWPFRDWVIESINNDKPFNQFIVEHLAGDVIGKDQPEIEIGSAFLVAGPYDDVGNQDPVAKANIRAATLDEMITATSSAFLGLTINCARCHHHKFDPVPTQDYYRIRAAFEGIEHGRRVIATKDQRRAHADAMKPLEEQKKDLSSTRDQIEERIDARAEKLFESFRASRPKIDPKWTEERFAPTDAKKVRFTVHAVTSDGPPPGRPNTARGRLTEFEVWSSDGRNVALASEGGIAQGERSAFAEDFPEAYGPQLCIDGRYGEQWFIGKPAVLTITLPKTETIERITFSNATRKDLEEMGQGATPCDYEIEVTVDGETWQRVADSDTREPWTHKHGIAAVRRKSISVTEREELQQINRELAKVQKRINQVQPLPRVFAGKYRAELEPTHVDIGGDPMKPGEAVVPASLSVLDQVTEPYELAADAPEGVRRLELAKWITASDNPLTPRVLANRVWHYHFNVGIVDTPSDFGYLGSLPTHPELLDYLATRLVENGWRLKPLHREILRSKTYLQSSQFNGEAALIDKEARLLWRFPPRRLGAEEIRDTMLSIAGELRLEPMGGPGFRLYRFTQNNVCTYFPLDQHGPETYRRGVYHQNARASVVDVLTDFDLPDIAFAAPRRANTTSPLQALTLLNHQFTLDMAAALAKRSEQANIDTDQSGTIPISRIYRIAYQRPPTEVELAAAEKLVRSHGIEAFCRAILNSNELIYLE